MCDDENRNRDGRIRVCEEEEEEKEEEEKEEEEKEEEEEEEGLKLARNIRDVAGVVMKLIASLPWVLKEGRGFTS